MIIWYFSDGSSGNNTPASLSGMKEREFLYGFQSTPLITSGLDDAPGPLPGMHRGRRASMQDAIDFRKIDSKLYDSKVLCTALSWLRF